jgi:hypothetical protein
MAEFDWQGQRPGESEEKSLEIPKWSFYATHTEVEYEGYRATFPPQVPRIYGQINSAIRIKSGDLLFNMHPGNVCYHFSQSTKKFSYVFELDWGPGSFLWSVAPDSKGNIFCSISGMRTSGSVVDADFGNWGGIAVVNPRQHALKTIAERGPIVDPYGIRLQSDGTLLVTDFSGFGSSGRVYSVDPLSGHIRMLAEGDYLVDPTTSFIDDRNVLWIANGDQDAQDGEVLAIDLKTKERRVVYPRKGSMSGALLGVCPSNNDDFLIAVKNEWAERIHSVVMLIEKSTGYATDLLKATEEKPQFYSTICSTSGSTLWLAECCERQLIEFDLVARKILSTYDLTPIMGGHHGMRNSFDAVSGFYVVP